MIALSDVRLLGPDIAPPSSEFFSIDVISSLWALRSGLLLLSIGNVIVFAASCFRWMTLFRAFVEGADEGGEGKILLVGD